MNKKNETINIPKGILIFGILEIIFSILGIISVILIIFLINLYPNIPLFQQLIEKYTVYDYFLLVITLILGVIGMIAGVGLLKLRSWARKLIINLAIFNISLSILNLVLKETTNISSIKSSFTFPMFIGWLYNLLIIGYFTNSKVKPFFDS